MLSSLKRMAACAVIVLCCGAYVAQSQSQYTFELMYASSNPAENEWAAAVSVDGTDNSSVLVGPVFDSSPGNTKPTLVKTDYQGVMQWTKSFDLQSVTDDYDVIVCANQDIVFTCGATHPTSGIQGALVVRTDPAGVVLWSKLVYCSIQHPTWVYNGFGLLESSVNGDIIVTGRADNTGVGPDFRDAFLCRLQSNGVLLWGGHYSAPNYEEESWDVEEDSNGNLIMVGSALSLNNGTTYAMVLATTGAGAFLWSNLSGANGWFQEYRSAVYDAGTNRIYCAGSSLALGSNNHDVLLAAFNNTTQTRIGALHYHDLQGSSDDRAWGIDLGIDNGLGQARNLVVAGETNTVPGFASLTDSYMFEITPTLSPPYVVFNMYGDLQEDRLYDIDYAAATGIGSTQKMATLRMAGLIDQTIGGRDYEFYHVQSDLAGWTGCEKTLPDPPETTQFNQIAPIFSYDQCYTSRNANVPQEVLLADLEQCAIVYMYCRRGVSSPQLPGDEAEFAAYPNPLKIGNTLRFEFQGDVYTHMEISDATGKVLLSEDLDAAASGVEMATNDWNAGVYFVKLTGPQGAVSFNKFMIIE